MRKAAEQENRRRKETTKRVSSKVKGNKKIQLNIKWDNKKIMTVVICFAIILCIIAVNNYTSLGLVLNKNINTEDTVLIELQTSNNKIIPFGSEILVYNRGTITCYNSYGKNTGEIKLEDTIEADILTAGKYIQVINKDKGIVYLFKNKYEVARIKIDGQIYGGNINEDGMSVIEYSSNGNKTALGIYDDSGSMRYNVKLSNNIIGKYILSDNSKYLAYVDVNVKGISARTNVNLINLSNIKEDVTNINTIHTVDNSLAYDIYWDGTNIISRFDENYTIYNVNSGKKETILISDSQVINIGDYDKRYAYTLIDENGDYALNIRKMISDSIRTIQIEDTPKYFEYENGIVYICYGKKIEAYNNLGMKIKNYDSSMVITEPVIFNNGRSLVMAISNKLVMFTI